MTDSATALSTCDLCDAYADELQVAAPIFRHYGGRRAFHGIVSTLECHEDNSLVRAAAGEPGAGRVLVVDGGGSLRVALLGDQIAALALANGWSGVVVHGAVRDVEVLRELSLGVMALAAVPLRSEKRGAGRRDVEVRFEGVTFVPGQALYADENGLIVAPRPLSGPARTPQT